MGAAVLALLPKWLLPGLAMLLAFCLPDPRMWSFVPTRADQVGVLRNWGATATAADARFDPARPTIVITHGLNPFTRLGHHTIQDHVAVLLAARAGATWNVGAWDWNAATMPSLTSLSANADNAEQQGHLLAAALRARGVDPHGLTLVGHSLGCVVVATAARDLADPARGGDGQPIARIILVDAVWDEHDRIYGPRGVPTAPLARRVENHWCPFPSGVGGRARRAGVTDIMHAEGRLRAWIGALIFTIGDHGEVLIDLIAAAGDPAIGQARGFADLLLPPPPVLPRLRPAPTAKP